MTEYILILVIFSSPNVSQAILFPSKAACENAKAEVQAADWASGPLSPKPRAICVPRNGQ